MTRSRPNHPCLAPPLLLIVLVLTPIVLGMAASAGAEAAVIATSVSGFEGGPAIASDGRIVVGERRGNGALRIRAIDPATRAATTLVSFDRLADPHAYTELDIAGSGAIVTGTLQRWREATGPQSGPEQDIPTLQSSSAMTVLPTVAPLASCSNLGPEARLDAAGGENFVATIGAECGPTSTAVRLRTPAGPITIPVGPSYPNPGIGSPGILALRATGPMVAWVEQGQATPGGPLLRTVVVARGATGQVLLRAAGEGVYPSPFGLGADGTVAISTLFPACSLAVVAPAAPALRALRLAGGLCAYSRSDRSLAVAGGRLVYGAITGFGVSDLRGAGHPLAVADSPWEVESPVAFDGRTAFVVRAGCDRDRLLAVDADAVGDTPRGRVRDACPVRRSGASRLRVTRGGRAAVRLRCSAGCRGTLRLVQQRRGHRERLVGSAGYAGTGTVVVAPRIARYARGLAGCAGGLRVNAVIFRKGRTSPFAPVTKGLGAYRIASGSACRRSGGPAFTPARPGPRP